MTTWFWILTARDNTGAHRTLNGTSNIKTGGTRQQLFKHVCDRNLTGGWRDSTVIFYSAEPNETPATAAGAA